MVSYAGSQPASSSTSSTDDWHHMLHHMLLLPPELLLPSVHILQSLSSLYLRTTRLPARVPLAQTTAQHLCSILVHSSHHPMAACCAAQVSSVAVGQLLLLLVVLGIPAQVRG